MRRPRTGVGAELVPLVLILACLAGSLALIVAVHRRAAPRKVAPPAVAVAVAVAPPPPEAMPAPVAAIPAPEPEPEPEPPPPPPAEDPTPKALAKLTSAEAEELLEASRADRKAAALDAARKAAEIESERWRRRESLAHAQLSGIEAKARRSEAEADALAFERDALLKERDARKAALARSRSRPGQAILPHKGPNGTWRRPIVVECTNGMAILRPQGIGFGLLELAMGFGPNSNPFVATVAREAVRIRMAESPDGAPVVPYIFFLVRPDGIRPYYEARGRLEPLGITFGYELADQDWDVEFPDLDDRATWDGSAPAPPPGQDPLADRPPGPPGSSPAEDDHFPTWGPVRRGGPARVGGPAEADFDWPGRKALALAGGSGPSPDPGPGIGTGTGSGTEPGDPLASHPGPPGTPARPVAGLGDGPPARPAPFPLDLNPPGRDRTPWDRAPTTPARSPATGLADPGDPLGPGSAGEGKIPGSGPAAPPGGRPAPRAATPPAGPDLAGDPGPPPSGTSSGEGGIPGTAGDPARPGSRPPGGDPPRTAMPPAARPTGPGPSDPGNPLPPAREAQDHGRDAGAPPKPDATGHDPVDPGTEFVWPARPRGSNSRGQEVERGPSGPDDAPPIPHRGPFTRPLAMGVQLPEASDEGGSPGQPGSPGTPRADGAGDSSGNRGTGGGQPARRTIGQASGSPGGPPPSGTPPRGAVGIGVGMPSTGPPGSPGSPSGGQGPGSPTAPELGSGLIVDRRFEVVVVCGPRGVIVQPGGYRVTADALKDRDQLLKKQMVALVKARRASDPKVIIEPRVRFLVQPGGDKNYWAARSQVLLSGLDWPSTTQVADPDPLAILPSEGW